MRLVRSEDLALGFGSDVLVRPFGPLMLLPARCEKSGWKISAEMPADSRLFRCFLEPGATGWFPGMV